MSYHEGSNWQAKKEDAGKPLYENEKVNKEQQNNPKHGLISIKVMQDDGEWYLIPSVLEDTFNSALKDANFNEEGNDRFIKLFSQYRVIGDLSSIKLYKADKKHTGAIEYATKLHQEQQTTKVLEYDNNRLQGEVEGCKVAVEELKEWKQQAIELLDPLFEYGHSKEAGITLGKSITAVVLERCKQADTARALLKKITASESFPKLRDYNLYNEIKTFLDGK